MTSGDTWEVAVDEPNDRTQPQGDTVTVASPHRTEDDARAAFETAKRNARSLSYKRVVLRLNGKPVEEWPEPQKDGAAGG